MLIVLNVICSIPLVLVVVSYLMYRKPAAVYNESIWIEDGKDGVGVFDIDAYNEEALEQTANEFYALHKMDNSYSADCVSCGYEYLKVNLVDGQCKNCSSHMDFD